MSHTETIVGLISDTHGLLRPEAVDALRGSDVILHAGDIGAPEILAELRRIAPVHAVRGNIDRERWASKLPLTDVIECGGLYLFMLHDISKLDIAPAAAGFAAVIYGHSHKPSCEMRNSVLYFNPGSAGPRRFHLPISVGRMRISNGVLTSELIRLDGAIKRHGGSSVSKRHANKNL